MLRRFISIHYVQKTKNKKAKEDPTVFKKGNKEETKTISFKSKTNSNSVLGQFQ